MHTNSTRQKETVEEMKILEKKDTENNADQKRYILEMEQLQKDNVTHKKERDELEKNLSVYSEKIPEMEAENEQLRESMNKAKEEFDEIDSRIQSEIEGTKSELASLEEKKGKLRLKIQVENNQIERAKEIADGISLKQEEKDLKIITQNIDQENANLQNLEADYKKICEQFEQTNDRKIKELEAKATEAKIKKQEIEEQIIRIVNEIEDAKGGVENTNMQNKILEICLRAQEQGKLSGIRGRLGDLGIIDRKYDIAISNACPNLNNIVVEKVTDANKILNFLRVNKIGMTKCIALDQTAISYEQAVEAPFTPPAESLRLFDLVKPNSEEYRIAFFSVMFNTLVVKDMDKANEIAFGHQRQRVVTLNGELIEKTGVISGGGKPRRGLMALNKKDNVSVSRENVDVDALIDKRQKLGAALAEIEQEINSCYDQIFSLKNNAAGREAEAFRERYPAQKKMISHRLLKSEEELKEIQERYEQQTQKKQEKQQIYEQLTDSIDSQARKELEEIDERIQELQTEIANAGGEEYVEMKERYEEFKSQFDAKLEIMGKAKSMQEVGKNQLEKISVDIEENKSKIAEKQELIQQLSERSKELEADVEKLLLTQTELRKEKKEVDQEWKDESKLLEEVKEDMRKFKNEIETIQKAVDKIDAELSDFLRRQIDISKNVKGKFKTLKKNINDLNEILELNKLEDNIDQADDLDYAEAKEETKEDLEEHKENIKQEDMQVDCANQDSEEEIDTNRVNGSEGKRKKLYWPDLLKEDKKPDEFKLKISECIELASYIDEITQEFEEVDKEVDETEANFTVIDEYRKQMRSFRDANKILLNFKRKEKDIMEGLEQIKKKKYKKFMDGFTIIKEKLKEMYRFITGEGDAELDLKDSLDPFIEGVVFTVRPPKKSWKQISHLSGGEKTLASLSLIFALHHFKPTPIYCMDEIDAALDYRNVSIVASYVKRQACNAQFIVISLRQNMFEMSDKMVGIYKIKDVTRTVCIAPRLFEKNLTENGSIPN